MTFLFGSVEYFESELLNTLENWQESGSVNASLKGAYQILLDDLCFDFVCDDNIKKECLNNLKSAFLKVSSEKHEDLLVLA
ncbi:hypothetical protein [Neobacillus terrae]|uniref:hypothetical protein n=1 Tax=Neobacillus terrae TaxID=3034837 RepID=UPI001408E24B|nr:hypothetical protein [Neobacillus terrae]NHM30934.1 hypothetical protein [Neobacillus terrae]